MILDVVMPRMAGRMPMSRCVRQAVIFVDLHDGYSAEMVQSRFVKQKVCEELGAVVIQKPYNVEGLGRKVREYWIRAERVGAAVQGGGGESGFKLDFIHFPDALGRALRFRSRRGPRRWCAAVMFAGKQFGGGGGTVAARA